MCEWILFVSPLSTATSSAESEKKTFQPKLNQTQEGRRKKNFSFYDQKYFSPDFVILIRLALEIRSFSCRRPNGALNLMKFHFYCSKVLLTERNNSYRWNKFAIARWLGAFMGWYQSARYKASRSASLGEALNLIRARIKRKLNCVYQF